jgi:hypothetical protein
MGIDLSAEPDLSTKKYGKDVITAKSGGRAIPKMSFSAK